MLTRILIILTTILIFCSMGIHSMGCTGKGVGDASQLYPPWVDPELIRITHGFWEDELSRMTDEMVQDLYGLNDIGEARQCELKNPFLIGKLDLEAYDETADPINIVMVQDGIGVCIYFKDQYIASMVIYKPFGEWRVESVLYAGHPLESKKDKFTKIYDTYDFFNDGNVLLGSGNYHFVLKGSEIRSFIEYGSGIEEFTFYEPNEFIDKEVQRYQETKKKIEDSQGKIIMTSDPPPDDDPSEIIEWKKWIEVNK